MLLSGVRRRSWLAVAALLGLVGSLLSVGVFPAGGVEGEADNEAVYSACVGPALESAGLVDMEGSFAEDAVNCMAHFGVTRGRTATTYDPGAPVSRWQMALFLSRAAGPAGVVLPANPADEFTDVAGLPEEMRTAINQVAALDIMPGRTGTTFGPGLSVSRAQMALMLDAFLLAAEKGSGLGLGALGGNTDELEDVVFDDSFDDIDNVTRGEYSAIRRMYELGVARGTSDDSFSPGAQVTRSQMAVFITRMLAHTLARPAGLTLQSAEASVEEDVPVGLAVSVRGSDLLPMPDAVVDVFSATNPDDAFGADGRCSADDVSVVGGSVVCEIAFGDEVAGPSGDVEYSETFTASSTLWAWTGDVGDRFDSDDTVSSSVELAVTKPAVKLRVTDDLADNATAAKFGDRVAFTLQLVDEDGNAVSDKDVSVAVASALVTNESGSTGDLPQSSGTTTYKTDASGKIELSFVRTDPRAGSDKRGDVAFLDLDITPPAALEDGLEDKTALMMAGVEAGALVRNAPPIDDAAVVWRDSVATASVLTLTQDVEYHEADKGGVAHTVRATLTDQYGDPISRRAVEFASDDAAGVGAAPANVDDDPIALRYYNADKLTSMSPDPELNRVGGTRAEDVDPTRGLTGSVLRARTKTTNRSGVATLTYTRESDATGIETIVARVKAELSTSLLAQARNPDHLGYYEDKWDARSGDILAERIYHYWASEPSRDGSASGRLMVNDAENNRLILVGGNTVSMVEYDANDQLTATSGAVTLDDFEKDVKDNAKHASVTAYQTDSRKVSQITATDEWARLFPFGADEETGDNLLQRFGVSFAADGGVIVVGAPRYQYQPGSTNRRVGRVYVYNSPSDTTPAILEMPSGDRVSNTYFGSVVDISGNTIVVSTRQNKRNAYVFVKPSSGGWVSSDTPITFDETTTRYGKQVAIDGDTLVVGYSGGVYVYERSATTGWEETSLGSGTHIEGQQIAISGSDPTPTSHCHSNRCLAVYEAETDDDTSTIVLSSPRQRPTLPAPSGGGSAPKPAQGFTGYVDVVSKTGADWTSSNRTVVRWLPPATAYELAESRWGQSVAVSGDTIIVSHEDLPLELAKRVVVRPDFDDTSNTVPAVPSTGSVYVYTKPEAGWAATTPHTATLSVPVGRGYGAFGAFADISSDGNTIAVSQHYAQQGDWLGAVHVYTKPSSGWANSTAPDGQYTGPVRNGRFGWGTAIDSTNGAIWAALRQDKTGDTTEAVTNTGECSSGDVTVGTETISIKEHCLRYSPVYMIDR